MAYAIRYALEVVWQPDGAGPMTVPDAQRKKFVQSAIVPIAGGDSLTQANLNSAITGGMTTDLEAQTALALGQMQAWNSGGG
jgi:hypothetical protein